MQADYQLSISIVHHKNKKLLEKCLDSIFRETKKTKFKIILVDNCSNEGIADLINKKYPEIKLIQNKYPEGFAKNQNKALKIAASSPDSGDYLLILNNDTVILDSAIDKMIDFMDKNPSVGLLGCKMFTPDSRGVSTKGGSVSGGKFNACTSPSKYPFTPAREFLETFMGVSGIRKLFPNSTFLYSIGCSDLGPGGADREGNVAHIGGACMLTRKEVIKQVGLFDENYFMFVEETDWCHRIKANGWQIYYYPSAYIIHYGAKSLNFFDKERKKLHEKSLDYFFRKHYGKKGFYLHRFLRLLLFPLFIINIRKSFITG